MPKGKAADEAKQRLRLRYPAERLTGSQGCVYSPSANCFDACRARYEKMYPDAEAGGEVVCTRI